MIQDQNVFIDIEKLTPFERAEIGLVAMAARISLMITMQEIVSQLEPETYETLTEQQKQQIDADIITLASALEQAGISA